MAARQPINSRKVELWFLLIAIKLRLICVLKDQKLNTAEAVDVVSVLLASPIGSLRYRRSKPNRRASHELTAASMAVTDVIRQSDPVSKLG